MTGLIELVEKLEAWRKIEPVSRRWGITRGTVNFVSYIEDYAAPRPKKEVWKRQIVTPDLDTMIERFTEVIP